MAGATPATMPIPSETEMAIAACHGVTATGNDGTSDCNKNATPAPPPRPHTPPNSDSAAASAKNSSNNCFLVAPSARSRPIS